MSNGPAMEETHNQISTLVWAGIDTADISRACQRRASPLWTTPVSSTWRTNT